MAQLRVADNGPQARKLLDALLRSVHNLKASASAGGLSKLATAAHKFEDVLHALRKHAVQQSVAEGARLFLLQTDFDASDFDRQFQSLKETLNNTGEVISTEPSTNEEIPRRVNFGILYAAKQIPADLPPTVSIAEISTPDATGTFEQHMPMLERAFEEFALVLVPIRNDDALTQALRAGEAAAQATGKQVDFEIRGDATLANRLITYPLLHLVRNAVDHGIETRGKVIIEIMERDDQISITVTDDGRGIAPSLIEKIFEPGFSTKPDISDISGRGVGLDVVKTTIEDLGGTVNVRSTPGQGTTFELTLPSRSARHPR
jgi:chemotaxis protein histidine kinase CheA